MADSAFGAQLRAALEKCEGAAEGQWWQAQVPSGISREEWRVIVHKIGRPLTWRIWEIAIDEASRLSR